MVLHQRTSRKGIQGKGFVYGEGMRRVMLAGRSIGAVGLGDTSFARAAARGRDRADVERAVHDAIEASFDLIDVDHDPDVERAVGNAVRALRARDRVVIATRVPALAERAGAPTRELLPERLPLRYVQEQIESSLRASKLDALPLAQLPLQADWIASRAWPELRGTCARLVDEGKVLAWGAIGDEPALAGEAWLASIAIQFSICERVATPVIAAAAANKIAVLAWRPLAGGALAGTIGPGVNLPPRDDRRAIEAPQLETIAVGAAKLARLVSHVPPAATSCDASRAAFERTPRPELVEIATLAELALRYVIDRGTIALPRIHRRADLGEALMAASAAPLAPEVIARIHELWPDPTP